MATLAKLTSLSTQTLSLLLERQRLQTLTPASTGNSLHLPQITRNLGQLRTGVADLEEKDGNTEAVRLLKNQYERMRGMLGAEADAAGIPRLQQTPPITTSVSPAASSSSLPVARSPLPPPVHAHDTHSEEVNYAPYTDDPEAAYPSTDTMLHSQRTMMEEQDMHLDHLATSIGRQRDLSLQINEELEVHHGLLEEMDEELDRTGNRLSQARRKLDKVARGAKENSSTVMIGLIIFILLILIIVFKT
ncbi:hypothetical protein PHLGIDRAFT_28014 [Phlebiopsis gigantea 11061_1 CR5-6]|uniref:t-SNARE coiled-coil homology domain-containing protein n=1 Tax=Phlebiopsis gigantea (strain 11061_1 CR5-6) TaxID=745531 RepID=A0A0C3SCY3_PHLG1|nr:hypothetical protein PHLGIDRAFT_28014 [Phlebiopsis gigantea 11061_1 CR5-6]